MALAMGEPNILWERRDEGISEEELIRISSAVIVVT
jgi:hypothetical protein